MRILILGAAGFIGSHLARYAQREGHAVIALCRSGNVPGFSGTTVSWSLGQPVLASQLRDADCVLHLAHDFDGEAGARLTKESTLARIREIRAAGVPKQIFFSSYSAGRHSKSLYGQTKFAIEQSVSGWNDVIIVRPGLVLGPGGIYGRIHRWAGRLPIIPLPDGGQGRVPVISIERLCRETLTIAHLSRPSTEWNLFEPQPISLRQLVLEAAAQVGRSPKIVPVPSSIVLTGLRMASALRLRLPVNADNLAGFLANQEAKHISSLRSEAP